MFPSTFNGRNREKQRGNTQSKNIDRRLKHYVLMTFPASSQTTKFKPQKRLLSQTPLLFKPFLVDAPLVPLVSCCELPLTAALPSAARSHSLLITQSSDPLQSAISFPGVLAHRYASFRAGKSQPRDVREAKVVSSTPRPHAHERERGRCRRYLSYAPEEEKQTTKITPGNAPASTENLEER